MSRRQNTAELRVIAICVAVAIFGAILASSGNHIIEVIGVGLILLGMGSLWLMWFIT